MVAGLAHESRNALQRAQACIEMLTLVVRDRPDALELMARLQNAQDHLHHLYEDVRSYAAPIALERRPCDLGDIWREAWAHLDKARRDKGAVLLEHVEGVDLRCTADPFRMGQVFRNVLENALAAAPAPATIDISAAESCLDGRKALELAIRDSGPGVDPALRRRVFEPFYTTKARGTGLGLAIVERIVQAHGGRISLAETDAKGAEFRIILSRDSP
jgi:signal transduction histidine kinase